MRVWLLVVWGLILTMVLLGGITRLTGSGLSMVEWHPLMGAVPPLDDAAWLDVFEQYRRSPQFQQVNHWMQLEDFKRIFLWEYLHRLFGRLIGVVFLLPWLYFLVRRRLEPGVARRTFIAFVLGGLQGLLGWYMVLSGLVDVPRVSHFRLAAHLLLAFAAGMWVLWTALGLAARSQRRSPAPRPVRFVAFGLLALLCLQIAYGAFMAGTHAGLYYGTFPDMNGAFLPGRFFGGASLAHDLLYNPSAIHWVHRFLAWLVLMLGLGLWAYLYRGALRWLARTGAVVAALAVIQFNLGALTVVYRVPIGLAVAHQGMAYLLLSAAVVLLHRSGGHDGERDATGQALVGDGGVARPG